MARIFFAVVLTMVLVSFPVHGSQNQYNLTPNQIKLMTTAYVIGKETNLSKAMVGILYRETRAGEDSLIGDRNQSERSYGVMQIKLHTARHIQRLCPDLSRDHKSNAQLRADLIYDEQWNMQLAHCYLQWIRDQGVSWRMMLVAYNQGLTGSREHDENHPYAYWIAKHVREGVIRYFIDNYIE